MAALCLFQQVPICLLLVLALATATGYNVYLYTVNSGGTFTTTAGTQAAEQILLLCQIYRIQKQWLVFIALQWQQYCFAWDAYVDGWQYYRNSYNTVGMVDFVLALVAQIHFL